MEFECTSDHTICTQEVSCGWYCVDGIMSEQRMHFMPTRIFTRRILCIDEWWLNDGQDIRQRNRTTADVVRWRRDVRHMQNWLHTSNAEKMVVVAKWHHCKLKCRLAWCACKNRTNTSSNWCSVVDACKRSKSNSYELKWKYSVVNSRQRNIWSIRKEKKQQSTIHVKTHGGWLCGIVDWIYTSLFVFRSTT